MAEFQKLFLGTGSKQNGHELSGRNYYPKMKEDGNALVLVLGSTPGTENRITFIDSFLFHRGAPSR